MKKVRNMYKVYLKYHLPGFIAAMFLIISVNKSFAQQLDFDEIKVIAPYEPTISDAFKINFNPKIDDTLKVNLDFSYLINPIQIPTRFTVEPITPARMRGEPLTKLYNGFVKAGLGNYTTPYAEAFYNSLRSNEYAYGVHLKHLSSGGGIQDYAHSGYSDNLLNLNARRFTRNHTLYAGIGYERNMVHFYGFKRDDFAGQPEMLEYIDDLRNKEIRQRFHFFNPQIGFKSNYLDPSKLHHSINVRYHFLADRYDAKEHNVGLDLGLAKQLPEDPLGFADSQNFNLDFTADHFTNAIPDTTFGRSLFRLTPTLSSKYRDFTFYIGVRALAQIDSASYARFYPVAGAEINLISNILVAYASLQGDMKKNTLRDLSTTNPFMNSNANLHFQNTKSILRSGFKGSISSVASYNFSVANSSIENYALFVTDTASMLGNRFDVIYDDLRLFNFRAELFSHIGERVQLRFASDYYQYTLDNEIEAWHEPEFKFTIALKYNMQDKIIVSADAFARNSIYARTFNELGEVDKTKIHGFHVDANIGIEYRYTKILSVFLNLNNVQNQPLQRWYNYPSQRFNVMGGVTYSF
jgi:hypothetical protein